MLRKNYQMLSIELLKQEGEEDPCCDEFEITTEIAEEVEAFFKESSPKEFFSFNDKDGSFYTYRTSLIKSVTIL